MNILRKVLLLVLLFYMVFSFGACKSKVEQQQTTEESVEWNAAEDVELNATEDVELNAGVSSEEEEVYDSYYFSTDEGKLVFVANRSIAQMVESALISVIDKKSISQIDRYFDDSFYELKFGERLDLGDFRKTLERTNNLVIDRDIYAIVQNDSWVAVYSVVYIRGTKLEYVDFFRIESDKIIERRSASMQVPPGENSPLVDLRKILTPDITRVRSGIEGTYTKVFSNADTLVMNDLFAEDFTHSYDVLSTGKEGIRELLSIGPINFDREIIVLGPRLGVLYVTQDDSIFVHIFRLNDQYKIDAMLSIGPQ